MELTPSITTLFPASKARAVMLAAMKEVLVGLRKEVYTWDQVKELTKPLADTMRERLKALASPRYKLFIQVVFSESKGQGVRVASRMLWDPASDVLASETFSLDLKGKDDEKTTIVCSSTVHAVWSP